MAAESVERQRIVVGVDGSASAWQAARWAAAEARSRRMPLLLAHAVYLPGVAYTGMPPAPVQLYDYLKQAGELLLAKAERDLTAEFPELTVKACLYQQNAVPMLTELSRGAHLLALGSRGLGGFSGMLAGSTAVGVAARGHCPVAVVRGAGDAEPRSTGPVVVGVDGSPSGEAALALAFEEASLRGVKLVAVHAWFDLSLTRSVIESVLGTNEGLTEHQLVLAERLAGYQETYPDVTVRRVVVTDRPVSQLLEQAMHAQLLVVGSRGRGGFTGPLLGSTSQALIHHAPCPLIVARGGA